MSTQVDFGSKRVQSLSDNFLTHFTYQDARAFQFFSIVSLKKRNYVRLNSYQSSKNQWGYLPRLWDFVHSPDKEQLEDQMQLPEWVG